MATVDEERDARILDVRTLGGQPYPTAADANAAFTAASRAAKNGVRSLPFSLGSDGVGTTVIDIPPGTWVITDPGALFGNEGMAAKAAGLRIRGAGPGITTVVFKPASAGTLCSTDYWQFIQMENITFTAATAGCTFMNATTTHNGQNYRFINCGFNKWKYNFYLDGSNNNSEWCWINCNSGGTETGGAWLRIPATGSDQFLNFWWFGGTHQSTNAPLIDADKGGHFKVYGVDCSGWGSSLSGPGYLFYLRGAVHALGVCTMLVDGLRVEGGSAYAGLLYSEWPHGSVAFRSVDWGSQVSNYTYGNTINITYADVDGPLYSFRDSILAGSVRVAFASNSWTHTHKIVFENCAMGQKTSPSDVVVYDASGASPNDTNFPPVEFVRCRNYGTNANALNAAGVVAWDATIGLRGDLVQNLTPRCISIRSVHGLPTTDVPYVVLPVGAIITSFEAISPAGGSVESDGGSWALSTTEGSPTTVATATVSGAMSAGFNVVATPATPFICDTTAKAKLKVTGTAVTADNNLALLLIKGYW